MKFQINEYVWDRTREGPGVIVGYTEGLPLPYSVAEITKNNNRLGRVGYRADRGLCRYVKLIVPEDEALRALDLSDTGAGNEVDDRYHQRVKRALKERGVETE